MNGKEKVHTLYANGSMVPKARDICTQELRKCFAKGTEMANKLMLVAMNEAPIQTNIMH